jgi:hypothetical protein
MGISGGGATASLTAATTPRHGMCRTQAWTPREPLAEGSGRVKKPKKNFRKSLLASGAAVTLSAILN